MVSWKAETEKIHTAVVLIALIFLGFYQRVTSGMILRQGIWEAFRLKVTVGFV
jgi:hypothetical protein